jgi:hypothetical protein
MAFFPFIDSEFGPVPQIAINQHISLVSFNLQQIFSLSLLFMTLTFFGGSG